jgi:stage V sporulation protein R
MDDNYDNRGELLLSHDHQGTDLRSDYAEATLGALARVWKRPVVLSTQVEGKSVRLRHDGKEHTVKDGPP